MPADPVTVDVIANGLKSLISEMDAAIERTSMSVVIREQHDFGMSLIDHRGRMISGTIFTGQTLAGYARRHPVHPGDVVMLNDPYLSHGEISHLGDTMLAVPIFWEDELLAWGIAWGHHMDIGADAPSGMPTRATEVFHEGLQIPPVKLYERSILNQGIEDLVEVTIPENSLVSPTYPAPVSLRHLTRGRLREILQAILAQIFPDTVPATANGSLNSYSLLGLGTNPENRWLCFEVTAAGGGGRPFSDGIDGYCFNNRLKNAPVEFVETVYPVRIEQYSLRADSAGAGKYRGGRGLIRAIRALRPANLHFLDERQRTQPWGLRGGGAAAANDAYVRRADGAIVMLPGKFDRFAMKPGDIFVMRTGGGGGWGDPHERDPDAVLYDVICGLLSAARAREAYGVVIEGNPPRVDLAATERFRHEVPAFSGWLDRGEIQKVPPPGTPWEMDTRPDPWLVMDGETASVEETVRGVDLHG